MKVKIYLNIKENKMKVGSEWIYRYRYIKRNCMVSGRRYNQKLYGCVPFK